MIIEEKFHNFKFSEFLFLRYLRTVWFQYADENAGVLNNGEPRRAWNTFFNEKLKEEGIECITSTDNDHHYLTFTFHVPDNLYTFLQLKYSEYELAIDWDGDSEG